MDASFEHYMVEKKKEETQLVLTDLDWLIVHPSALTDTSGTGRIDLGLAKVHTEIARDDFAATLVELLRAPGLNRLILELTGGDTAIREGIGALAIHSSKAQRTRINLSSEAKTRSHPAALPHEEGGQVPMTSTPRDPNSNQPNQKQYHE